MERQHCRTFTLEFKQNLLDLTCIKGVKANQAVQCFDVSVELIYKLRYCHKGQLIFHSDRDVQFTAEEFRKILLNFGIEQSRNCVGNCYENTPIEIFFATLKIDILKRKCFQTKRMARTAILENLKSCYNKKRLHSSLNYQTPDEVFYEQKYS